MPATPTPKYGLHRPAGGDNANVPADLATLTDQLDPKLTPYDAGSRASRPVSTLGTPGIAGREYRSTDDGGIDKDTGTGWATLRPALLAALPVTPDGDQIVDFQTAGMKTAGVGPWRLRYDSTILGPLKWAVVSAASLIVEHDASITHGSASYAELPGAPTISLPIAGDYLATVEATIGLPNGAEAACRVHAGTAPGTTATHDAKAAKVVTGSAIGALHSSVSKTNRLTGQPVGAVVRAYARISGAAGIANVDGLRISVVPQRVG